MTHNDVSEDDKRYVLRKLIEARAAMHIAVYAGKRISKRDLNRVHAAIDAAIKRLEVNNDEAT